MRDALTIMVVHFSRQQCQSLLNVGQDLRLKAGADLLQRINKPGHFVRSDPAVQRKPIEPGHFPPHAVISFVVVMAGLALSTGLFQGNAWLGVVAMSVGEAIHLSWAFGRVAQRSELERLAAVWAKKRMERPDARLSSAWADRAQQSRSSRLAEARRRA